MLGPQPPCLLLYVCAHALPPSDRLILQGWGCHYISTASQAVSTSADFARRLKTVLTLCFGRCQCKTIGPVWPQADSDTYGIFSSQTSPYYLLGFQVPEPGSASSCSSALSEVARRNSGFLASIFLGPSHHLTAAAAPHAWSIHLGKQELKRSEPAL